MSICSCTLWATLGEDCWKTVDRMAELGIVVVPGEFYGAFSQNHVRFSITATDANIAEAAKRLRDQAEQLSQAQGQSEVTEAHVNAASRELGLGVAA